MGFTKRKFIHDNAINMSNFEWKAIFGDQWICLCKRQNKYLQFDCISTNIEHEHEHEHEYA